MAVFSSVGSVALAAFLCAGVAGAQQSGDTAEQQQVRQLETTWANAMVKRDQYGLDLVLSPNFVNISGTGEVSTKNQQIAEMFSPNYPLETYHETLTSIRVLGDTAIAQGTYTLQRKDGGAGQSEKGVFTHVYQRVRQTWQCVNSQRTVVVERAAPVIAKKPEREGALPFHVPFLPHRKPKNTTEPDATVTEVAPEPAANGTAGAASSETNTTPAPAPTPSSEAPQLENPK